MIHGYFVHILVFHTKLEDYSACKGSGFTTNLGQNVLFCYLFLLYIYIYILVSFGGGGTDTTGSWGGVHTSQYVLPYTHV